MEAALRDVYILAPGASRHAPHGVVFRYSLRYDSAEGTSNFVGAGQGRYMLPTYAAARQYLDALLTNNPPDKLALYGGAKSLYVAFQACYATHYDPYPLNLGSNPGLPASLTDQAALAELASRVLAARSEADHEDGCRSRGRRIASVDGAMYGDSSKSGTSSN